MYPATIPTGCINIIRSGTGFRKYHECLSRTSEKHTWNVHDASHNNLFVLKSLLKKIMSSADAANTLNDVFWLSSDIGEWRLTALYHVNT